MGSQEQDDKFYYVYSCDLDANLQVKIGTLEGDRRRPDYEDLLLDPMIEFSGRWQQQCSDMYVEVQVLSGRVEIALPVTTSYKAFTTRWNWNEWLTLPVRYCDLPDDAVLRFTVFEPCRPQRAAVVGATSIKVFTPDRCLNQGLHDLRLSPPPEELPESTARATDGAAGDGGPGAAKSEGGTETAASTSVTIVRATSPASAPAPAPAPAPAGSPKKDASDQMERLSKLTKRHRNGQLQQIDWLDRLTFREIEVINEREKRSSSALYLMIEFPKIVADKQEYAMVYFEQGADAEEHCRTRADIVTVADHEADLDNLLELKHHHLARSLRSGVTDRDLKPDAATRDQLSMVVNAPPTRPTSREAQDLVWKYRFYLSSQSKALSKFLKCVNWEQTSESQQALDLMLRWAPIDPNQALELLGPSFTHPAVRAYAVCRLQQAPDEELLMYLLQLVQALRYEIEETIFAGLEVSPTPSRPSSLIITSLSAPPSDDGVKSECPSPVPPAGEDLPPASCPAEEQAPRPDPAGGDITDLSSFLISRACQNAVVANYLYWYLLIECDELDDPAKQDMRVRKRYLAVMKRFTQALNRGGADCRATKFVLSRQQHFISRLVKLFKTVQKESGNRRKKIEKMQSLLADPDALKFNFATFDPLPLPLDPEVRICGILPDKATLFKSALMPARLTFLTDTGAEFVAIFKYGDDLRQDQLILQIIMLMDKLLRRENLDLKLTPYRVLATSSRHGFVQFIESSAVAEVLSTEGSILNFFRKHHPSETGPYGVSADVMDTYIRSCAGYCVITYLLGVGDRHLDNLLLTKSGSLFHVDFGYILGRDPKPLPPPMKLSKEMVEAMGGINSEHYQTFRKQCYTAFLHLRRHADVILHLFSLMVDANIPDIALEPDKTVRKVQDKFRLDLSDEEAVAYMQNMIDVSVTAVMAALVEQLHKFAQYWRR
ncbi:phosphatidylinositol 3-kinase catalytic subunit type 3-like [Amphibalanus amphitrite]|uniref:phosphatidylinositol 3-kinase catalytic subunit type 3-like n=1 Tax=Amphibalanus amphitrite TaxID=1232801 RepID=UPI001C9092FE|nr:phosphatidylinositol 3-kinase catalytic subunit type 3-like [Amphibalanus amphitrite]XP_043215045.1 phosphatidylinositol 3-kinase catalytic subunit type 3-like [Amphibalanus amphitrite]XP_043215046.1 phosphatidylinositol 3-kinase catalytic subunit type 3-like [Amphibalanus amphitrite]XP_043225727.1 phosphatidylinositol 3-kinase catalytic subunit type 3-like [Amphibalanus amphitrite]XP_043225728.1 phosphatidylinositol 3-kinase catalytic subunit type 3-like [Amphibalanus amphitrite]XP_0432257